MTFSTLCGTVGLSWREEVFGRVRVARFLGEALDPEASFQHYIRVGHLGNSTVSRMCSKAAHDS